MYDQANISSQFRTSLGAFVAPWSWLTTERSVPGGSRVPEIEQWLFAARFPSIVTMRNKSSILHLMARDQMPDSDGSRVGRGQIQRDCSRPCEAHQVGKISLFGPERN